MNVSLHQSKIRQYRAGNTSLQHNKIALEIPKDIINLQRVLYIRPPQLLKRTWNICLTFLRGRLTFSLCINWCISSIFNKPSPFLSASSKVCFTHMQKGQEKHFCFFQNKICSLIACSQGHLSLALSWRRKSSEEALQCMCSGELLRVSTAAKKGMEQRAHAGDSLYCEMEVKLYYFESLFNSNFLSNLLKNLYIVMKPQIHQI